MEKTTATTGGTLATAEGAGVGPSELEEAKRAWATTYAGLSQEQIDRHILGMATLVQSVRGQLPGVLAPTLLAEDEEVLLR